MNSNIPQPLRTCACCKCQHPITEFYTTTGGQLDHYCKECRRKANRERYYTRRRNELKRRNYLVITDVSDKVLRMALIKNALRNVRLSVERKRRKEWAIIDAEE